MSSTWREAGDVLARVRNSIQWKLKEAERRNSLCVMTERNWEQILARIGGKGSEGRARGIIESDTNGINSSRGRLTR